DPKALFWIQIAHAVQYLVFPVRVEMNRTQREPSASPSKIMLHMALYAAMLLVASAVISILVPYSAMSVVGNVFGESPGQSAPILILMIINIHHYFTDGVIWKISNPEVRRELFAHVSSGRPVSAPPGALPSASTSTPRRKPRPAKSGR
ncbi:MAG TPA: hypothetical protein VHV78_01250, partial [Gemmatimonadaceae bacterium]|nr:hypothetical protein [Gemmatimonadaceae bacterium]